ncbi:MAG: hypothetical protein ABIN35_08530 [candidate division WOR-3 bacterium]
MKKYTLFLFFVLSFSLFLFSETITYKTYDFKDLKMSVSVPKNWKFEEVTNDKLIQKIWTPEKETFGSDKFWFFIGKGVLNDFTKDPSKATVEEIDSVQSFIEYEFQTSFENQGYFIDDVKKSIKTINGKSFYYFDFLLGYDYEYEDDIYTTYTKSLIYFANDIVITYIVESEFVSTDQQKILDKILGSMKFY